MPLDEGITKMWVPHSTITSLKPFILVMPSSSNVTLHIEQVVINMITQFTMQMIYFWKNNQVISFSTPSLLKSIKHIYKTLKLDANKKIHN